MIVSRKESPKAKAAREAAVKPNTPAPVHVMSPEQRDAFLRSRPDLPSGRADEG